MKRTVCCFFACLVSAHAEEVTRAWHMVVPPESIRQAETISEAPSPSIFISKGDHLADLSKALNAEETFGKGAWIAWNYTRHLLVIHGNRHTLAYADHAPFLWQDHLAGVTVAWYRGIGPGESVPADAKPVHRTEIFTDSYANANRKWEPANAGSLGGIDLDANVGWEPNAPSAEVRLSVGWQEKRDKGVLWWGYNGEIITEFQGGPERIVCQVISPTNEHWTITVKVRELLLDGTPLSESRWQEVEGKAEFAIYRNSEDKVNLLGQASVDGTVLNIADLVVLPYSVEDIFKGIEQRKNVPPEEPPLTAAKEKATLERPPYCKDAVFPEALKSYALVPMWDLKPLLRKLDIPFADTDWVAYEPQLDRILAASANPKTLDEMPLSFSFSCGLEHPNFAATVRGNTTASPDDTTTVGAKLISRVGVKTMVGCWDEHETTLLSIEMETSPDPDERGLNAGYQLDFSGFRDFPALKAEGGTRSVIGSEFPIQTNESGGRKTTVTAKLEYEPVTQ